MVRAIPMIVVLAVLHCTTTAFAEAPVCGDVNDSGAVNTTDALLVLKGAVGQPVVLPCAGYAGEIANCQGALSTTNADLATCRASTCGNDTAEHGEPCDGTDLHGRTCATEAPATPYGTLSCAKDCGAFDPSACVARFDPSGSTIIDHETGLEWEKKSGADGKQNFADPHDADNQYEWCDSSGLLCANPKNPFDGSAATEFLASLNGADFGPCYADHCDWRLPTIEELTSIVDMGASDCGSGGPCLAAVFVADASPGYWSASSWAMSPDTAFVLGVYFGTTSPGPKAGGLQVRAVRSRS